MRMTVKVQAFDYQPVEFDSGEQPTVLACYQALDALMAPFRSPRVQDYREHIIAPALEELRKEGP